MFVTVVAVLCSVGNVCVEEIVTDSSLDTSVTFQSCMVGAQAGLARWKGEHPLYHSEAWHIERYKCVPGHYQVKSKA